MHENEVKKKQIFTVSLFSHKQKRTSLLKRNILHSITSKEIIVFLNSSLASAITIPNIQSSLVYNNVQTSQLRVSSLINLFFKPFGFQESLTQ